MTRTQIQLDEGTCQRLRQRAYAQGCSMSAVVRDVLAEALGASKAKRRRSVQDFTSVGSGATRQGGCPRYPGPTMRPWPNSWQIGTGGDLC
jgi:plasmid stability protein